MLLVNWSRSVLRGRGGKSCERPISRLPVAQTVPIFAGFESGNLGALSGWTFELAKGATIHFMTNNKLAEGTQQFRFDQTGHSQDLPRSATVLVDLSSQTGATVFVVNGQWQSICDYSSHYSLSDECRGPRLESFVTRRVTSTLANVRAGGDGISFQQFGPLIQTDRSTQSNINFLALYQELATAGFAADNDVYQKFRHSGTTTYGITRNCC